MAQNNDAKGNLAVLMRGMKEVARVTFTKQPIETNFTPQSPDNTKKPEATPKDDKIPLRRISGSNELIIAPEYMPELVAFFSEHTIQDNKTVPCFFNNDSCDFTLCVFPRIMRPLEEQPFVKDIISVSIYDLHSGTMVANAEYNTMNPNAAKEFQRDMDALTPAYYRSTSDAPQHSLRDALMAKFPGLVVPEEPIFLEENEVGKEPK
jgi:hypothetical protein